jgi:hypothetical protein
MSGYGLLFVINDLTQTTFNEIIQLPRNMETYEMIKSGMFEFARRDNGYEIDEIH